MRGGGVARYTHYNHSLSKDVMIWKIICLSYVLWIEIKMHKLTVLCGVSYRPPNNYFEETETFLNSLQTMMDKIRCQIPQSFIPLVGDFNAHFENENSLENSLFGTRLYTGGNLAMH
jgi:hypothetical protein